MATSLTTAFDPQRDRLIALALADVGAIGPGDVPQAKMIAHASDHLNLVAKDIDKDANFTWRTVRRTLTLVAGTASYVLGADVLNLQPVARYIAPGETAGRLLYPIGAKEFMEISDRTSQGAPTQFWGERSLSGITLQLWQVPDVAGSVEYMASLMAKDFNLGTETADFQQRWEQTLLHGLVAAIAPGYGQHQLASERRQLFRTAKAEAMTSDNEQIPVHFIPYPFG